jgi:hypothetical protein
MIAIVYLILYFFILIYAAYSYIGMGLGMFRMMRSAGMRNAWMAWVPGCNIYAMGDLADRQTAANEGKSTAYRKKLVAWTIVTYALSFLFLIACAVFTVVDTVNDMPNGDRVEIPEHDMNALIVPSLFVLLALALLIAFYIVYMVCYLICLNKIYNLFAPAGAVGLTVLSVFVMIAVPAIFLVLSGRTPAVAMMQSSDQAPPAAPEAPAAGGQSFSSL